MIIVIYAIYISLSPLFLDLPEDVLDRGDDPGDELVPGDLPAPGAGAAPGQAAATPLAHTARLLTRLSQQLLVN